MLPKLNVAGSSPVTRFQSSTGICCSTSDHLAWHSLAARRVVTADDR